MTDRLAGFIVALDEDTRDDDAQATIRAIEMIKGVASVTPLVNDPRDYLNRERVRRELIARLWEVLKTP